MRTWKSILAAAALCAISVADAAGQTPANNTGLVLEIMARRPGVTAGDFDATQFQSYMFAPAAGMCGLTASDDPPANTPAAGWRVDGRVLGTTKGPAGDQLVVTIEWNRMWENGAATTQGPRGSVKLTMSGGDTVVLDRIAQAAAGTCTTGDLRLTTSVVARSEALRPESMFGERFARGFAGARPTAAGAGGRGALTPTTNATATGAAGARGGGRGVGTGMASTTGTVGTANATSVGRGSRGGAGDLNAAGVGAGGVGAAGAAGATGRGTASTATARGGASGVAGSTNATTMGRGVGAAQAGGRGRPGSGLDLNTSRQAYARGLVQYTSELWLVHKQPNGDERVQQLSIQFGPAGSDYSFPPVQVNTSRGIVTVDITGRLEMNPRPGEADPSARAVYTRLLERQRTQATTTASATTGATTPAVPDGAKIQLSISRRARSTAAALDVSGGSSMAIELPKPEEVLSFEFPALPKATEDLLAGHKFSIRLRVTAVK
jgi:hypothetical protein